MKILKKLLTLLPLLAICQPLITLIVAFGMSFGQTAGDYVREYDGNVSYLMRHRFSLWQALSETGNADRWGFAIGIEIFMLVSILILGVFLILAFLNLSNKVANGPLMLIVGILSFFVPFFVLPSAIGLSNLGSYLLDLGVGVKVCCWVAFGLSWLIFLSFILVYLLNVLLFKRLEKRRAEKAAAEAK